MEPGGGELGEAEQAKDSENSGHPCHCGYLASVPGAIRLFNIVLCGIILGLWIPGYEHDYVNRNQIENFRDFSKNYGAGYKSETLNQFVLVNVTMSMIISTGFLAALMLVDHGYVDWNRMNKIVHAGLAIFQAIGAICGGVGVWYFEENCCRVDLEWNGVGFRYKPALTQFGYPRNNNHCNCWLTKRASELDRDSRTYMTVLWEPLNYPGSDGGGGAAEESMYVSFAAHHIHLHVAAVGLMIVNAAVYFLASFFSKPKPKAIPE